MYYAPPFAGASTSTPAKTYSSSYAAHSTPRPVSAAASWNAAARTPDKYEAAASSYRGSTDGATSSATPRSHHAAMAAPPPINTASFMTQVQRPASTAANSPVKAASSQSAAGSYTLRSARTTTSSSSPSSSSSRSLLPSHSLSHRQLLVLDMDETLLHASVQPTADHHVRFRVEMSATQSVDVYVKFRPYVSEFLAACARHFEVAVFTASISAYANQVLDHLDPHGRYVHHRLFREHCTEMDGTYVKDLSLLGRPLHRISIVDNSPVAYSLHPQNAIPITSWFDDESDRELLELLPSLEQLARMHSVYDHLELNHPKTPSTPSRCLWR